MTEKKKNKKIAFIQFIFFNLYYIFLKKIYLKLIYTSILLFLLLILPNFSKKKELFIFYFSIC